MNSNILEKNKIKILGKRTPDFDKILTPDALNFLKEIGAPTKKWIMSYPYGSFDNNTISILKEKNCSYAFTSAQGIADLDKDRFKLPRKDTNDFPQ